MSRDTPVKLRIPPQDLQDFDRFALTVEAARQWTSALPVTSSSQVAGQLRDVIARLNRVELRPELRFQLMETLRPALLVALASLSRRFLRQPLVMPEEPRRMAGLVDDLYNLAGTGYTLVAVHAIQRRDSIREVNAAKLACESIHRALRFAGARLLQAFQLYRPVPQRGWLTLHQLYALAEGQRLTQLQVEDRLSGSGTIATAYLQALVTGCCRPNQLRQNDLSAIYRGLQEWAALLTLERDPEHKGLFLTDLDSDRPAMYSQLYRETPGPGMRYIDTAPLVEHLEKLSSQAEVVFDKDTVISAPLIAHLIHALSTLSTRNFARQRTSKSVWIGIGLSTCHYFMAGEQTFEQVLHGGDYNPPPSGRSGGNPFLQRRVSSDPRQQPDPDEPPGPAAPPETDQPLDRETLAVLEGREPAGDLPDEGRYTAHRVNMYDASPGGYCLEWSEALTTDIATGKIVCVRENESARWALAAVRWMSQLENSRTLVGLELLSPEATPYGACMPQAKKGEEVDPMRVLLLPEIKLVGQAPTLLTPRAGFRERQKIILLRHGEEVFIQLMRQVAITSAFVQFEFRYIKQLGEILAEDKSRPRDFAFDSLWTNI
ncbi:MAG: GTPase [Halieaceae bacterium]|jgi:hypothetical protein|nr:GTPase [Halieaceae bacterium]